jgi:hypothetical protein
MTDYTNVPIAAAGDWIDDAYLNTYLGDNFRAVFGALTAAGQLLVSTAANRLTKVAVTGNNGYLLTEDTSEPGKMKFAAPPSTFPAGGSAYQGVRQNSGASAKEWAAMPSVIRRQGGDANDWWVPGATTYTPTNAVMQVGCARLTTAVGTAYGTWLITFPVAFSNPPLVFVGPPEQVSGSTRTEFDWQMYTPTVSSFYIGVWSEGSASQFIIDIPWMAIGVP